MKSGGGLSAFSVLLLSAAAALVGLASLGMLNIQYTPSTPGRSIRVSYSLPDASARTVEAEVSSKLEGVLSGVSGVSGIISTSRRGGGRVTVKFRKGTDMAAARYELSSRLRSVYDQLPGRLAYPEISLDASGSRSSTAITYELRSPLSTHEIRKYAEDHLVPALSRIAGVDRVELHGATPYHYVITFDAPAARALGISGADISAAVRDWYGEVVVGLADTGDGIRALVLAGGGQSDPGFGNIPVCVRDGHLVYLRDIASWRYEEAVPLSYFRVNGLNTLTLSVSVSGGVNLLGVAAEVRGCMERQQVLMPEGMSARVSYDSSEYVREELRKIVLRTALCLVLLLLFVFLTSRSLSYTLMIATTIVLNLLVALAIYSFSGLTLHIYTLAGISVSLGIIIDTTIVMTDHYRRRGDRSVFPYILGATLTTVGALLMTLLLPESERKNLTDFIVVVIVNLGVSLAVAWSFVPALLDKVQQRKPILERQKWTRMRRMARWRGRYESYIRWGLRHRWVYVLLFVAAFGVPLCLIPRTSELEGRQDAWVRMLRAVASWTPYESNRAVVDRAVGGSFALFHSAMDRVNLYREPERTVLSIQAGMLEGASATQLNEVVKSMENYLAQFPQIELFTTEVRDYDDALINVYFSKETENTAFPYTLKGDVTAMAVNFGGANWRISGVDDNYFNNNIVSSHRFCGIVLRGYNFDELLSYAEDLRERISGNRRISGAEVRNTSSRSQPGLEYNISYDGERMALAGITPARYYKELSSMLYSSSLGVYPTDRGWRSISLKSSEGDGYDLWHVGNEALQIDSLRASLGSVGSIEKRRSALDITRRDQSYELEVAFDFIGSYELQRRFISDEVARLNSGILPVGYKAEDRASTWFDSHKDSYLWIILLILLVIYVITAITLESFRLPFAVVWMIPISFIGTFLAFGLSDLTFDQGGLASFVMLSGLTVNAGIYLLGEWQAAGGGVRGYLKSFGIKATPIMLTVLSTVLGLLPFLSDGPGEVFWFDFAVGTISGMLFSVLALIFWLPVFTMKRKDVLL